MLEKKLSEFTEWVKQSERQSRKLHWLGRFNRWVFTSDVVIMFIGFNLGICATLLRDGHVLSALICISTQVPYIAVRQLLKSNTPDQPERSDRVH